MIRAYIIITVREGLRGLFRPLLTSSLGISDHKSPILQLIRPEVSRISPKLTNVVFCLENWAQQGDPNGVNLTHRGIYSVVVAFLQYLFPLLIVLAIYGLIYRFLRQQQYPRHLRQNKTNTLLASISITHCIIWLPFSLFNIVADLWPDKVNYEGQT